MSKSYNEFNDKKAIEANRAAAVKGLAKGSGFLLTEANKICPHDSGRLEESGFNDVDGQELKAVVAYTQEYAAPVHEMDSGTNFKGDGERKWLERTGDRKGEEALETVAEVIKSELP